MDKLLVVPVVSAFVVVLLPSLPAVVLACGDTDGWRTATGLVLGSWSGSVSVGNQGGLNLNSEQQTAKTANNEWQTAHSE